MTKLKNHTKICFSRSINPILPLSLGFLQRPKVKSLVFTIVYCVLSSCQKLLLLEEKVRQDGKVYC